MQDRPTEAVQSGDLQRVAVAKHTQNLVESGAARLRAARMVNVDVLLGYAGAPQRVDLVVRILVSGRDARVAEQHASRIPGGAEITVVVSRRELSTPLLARKRWVHPVAPDASANGRFSSLCIPSWVAATVVEKRCA